MKTKVMRGINRKIYYNLQSRPQITPPRPVLAAPRYSLHLSYLQCFFLFFSVSTRSYGPVDRSEVRDHLLFSAEV